MGKAMTESQMTDTQTPHFHQYRRKQIAELADWHPGFDMTGVSVSAPDKAVGSPKEGDKIARNPANHADRWLVAAEYFAVNFEPVERALTNSAPQESATSAHSPLRVAGVAPAVAEPAAPSGVEGAEPSVTYTIYKTGDGFTLAGSGFDSLASEMRHERSRARAAAFQAGFSSGALDDVIRELNDRLSREKAEREAAEQRAEWNRVAAENNNFALEEERAVVDRVWKALGITSYEQAKPYAIDKHVERLVTALAAAQGGGRDV
jgi:hypothetical protein